MKANIPTYRSSHKQPEDFSTLFFKYLEAEGDREFPHMGNDFREIKSSFSAYVGLRIQKTETKNKRNRSCAYPTKLDG